MSEYSVSLGKLVMASREEAGLTLRQVAKAIGISIPFLHDVEHGRRPLAVGWWTRFVAAIPGLTLKDMAEARISGAVRVEIRVDELTKAQRVAVISRLISDAEAEAEEQRREEAGE